MDEIEITERLKATPHWIFDGINLKTEIELESYEEGISIVNFVAEIAEELNHHPEITIQYGKVTIQIHTHDRKTITDLDFIFVKRVEAQLE